MTDDENQTVRVAIYTRVSTDEQANEGFSIPAQLERIKAYCKAHDYIIAGIYVDGGESGRTINRKEYQRMIAECGMWDSILVLKMDRIHRNSGNFNDMMKMLKKLDKGFISVMENFDSTTAMGRFFMKISQDIAELESDQIGERVFIGMKQKANTTTDNLGKNCPYGYTQDDDGKFVVNESESNIIEDMFNLYVSGKSIRYITKYLNTNYQDKTWHSSTVAYVLGNSFYAGCNDWDSISRKGNHKPIIDKELFNNVQIKMATNSKRYKIKPVLVGDTNGTKQATN